MNGRAAAFPARRSMTTRACSLASRSRLSGVPGRTAPDAIEGWDSRPEQQQSIARCTASVVRPGSPDDGEHARRGPFDADESPRGKPIRVATDGVTTRFPTPRGDELEHRRTSFVSTTIGGATCPTSASSKHWTDGPTRQRRDEWFAAQASSTATDPRLARGWSICVTRTYGSVRMTWCSSPVRSSRSLSTRSSSQARPSAAESRARAAGRSTTETLDAGFRRAVPAQEGHAPAGRGVPPGGSAALRAFRRVLAHLGLQLRGHLRARGGPCPRTV